MPYFRWIVQSIFWYCLSLGSPFYFSLLAPVYLHDHSIKSNHNILVLNYLTVEECLRSEYLFGDVVLFNLPLNAVLGVHGFSFYLLIIVNGLTNITIQDIIQFDI